MCSSAWPQDYSAAFGRNRGYDFEGATTINLSPGGYLWDSAAAAESFGAALSASMNFDQEDQAPMAELNAVIWCAVKGADVPYPENLGGGGATQSAED